MPLEYPAETPSQTAGPYVHIGLMPSVAGFAAPFDEAGRTIAAVGVPGTRVRIVGTVRDGYGAPVRDAVIEVWQADAEGRLRHPEDPRQAEIHDGFTGFGRVATSLEDGTFAIDTIKPGRVGASAPHLSLWIVARGINLGLHTRLYFGDEDNSADPLLALVDPPARRQTLIAAPDGDGGYLFDIRLQGENETVFLDV